MGPSDIFVSVVAPLREDVAYLRDFVSELMPLLRAHYTNYELVLVDDGSEDGTDELAQDILRGERCIRLIRLSRVFGRDVAITAGLESAIGDFVVVMIPENDPPAFVPEMVEKCRNSLGVVVGVSLHASHRSWLGRWLAGVFHWYFRRYQKMDLVPNSTHFRVLSRQAVNALTQIRGHYRQLRWLSSIVGFKKNIYPYHELNRSGRVRKRDLVADVSEAIDLLVINGMNPLRLVSSLGVLAAGLNLVYLIYVVLIFLLKKDVIPGWTTLSLQQGGMFFLIFVILSVLSEYVGRILDESRDRPLYFVMDEKNSGELLSDLTRRNIVKDSN
jgi:glycosyltransferase involved in cell wall biosynthesis